MTPPDPDLDAGISIAEGGVIPGTLLPPAWTTTRVSAAESKSMWRSLHAALNEHRLPPLGTDQRKVYIFYNDNIASNAYCAKRTTVEELHRIMSDNFDAALDGKQNFYTKAECIYALEPGHIYADCECLYAGQGEPAAALLERMTAAIQSIVKMRLQTLLHDSSLQAPRLEVHVATAHGWLWDKENVRKFKCSWHVHVTGVKVSELRFVKGVLEAACLIGPPPAATSSAFAVILEDALSTWGQLSGNTVTNLVFDESVYATGSGVARVNKGKVGETCGQGTAKKLRIIGNVKGGHDKGWDHQRVLLPWKPYSKFQDFLVTVTSPDDVDISTIVASDGPGRAVRSLVGEEAATALRRKALEILLHNLAGLTRNHENKKDLVRQQYQHLIHSGTVKNDNTLALHTRQLASPGRICLANPDAVHASQDCLLSLELSGVLKYRCWGTTCACPRSGIILEPPIPEEPDSPRLAADWQFLEDEAEFHRPCLATVHRLQQALGGQEFLEMHYFPRFFRIIAGKSPELLCMTYSDKSDRPSQYQTRKELEAKATYLDLWTQEESTGKTTKLVAGPLQQWFRDRLNELEQRFVYDTYVPDYRSAEARSKAQPEGGISKTRTMYIHPAGALFTAWRRDPEFTLEEQELAAPIIKFMMDVAFGGNREVFTWVLWWMRCVIEGRPTQCALVLASLMHGVGKSFCAEILKLIVAPAFAQCNSEALAFDTHNHQLPSQVLINFEEFFPTSHINQFKALLTASSYMVNPKFRDAYLTDVCASVIITCNLPSAQEVLQDGNMGTRRLAWWQWQVSLGEAANFKKLATDMGTNLEVRRAVCKYIVHHTGGIDPTSALSWDAQKKRPVELIPVCFTVARGVLDWFAKEPLLLRQLTPNLLQPLDEPKLVLVEESLMHLLYKEGICKEVLIPGRDVTEGKQEMDAYRSDKGCSLLWCRLAQILELSQSQLGCNLHGPFISSNIQGQGHQMLVPNCAWLRKWLEFNKVVVSVRSLTTEQAKAASDRINTEWNRNWESQATHTTRPPSGSKISARTQRTGTMSLSGGQQQTITTSSRKGSTAHITTHGVPSHETVGVSPDRHRVERDRVQHGTPSGKIVPAFGRAPWRPSGMSPASPPFPAGKAHVRERARRVPGFNWAGGLRDVTVYSDMDFASPDPQVLKKSRQGK